MKPKLILLILALFILTQAVSAEQTSAYGGVLQNYTNTSDGVDIHTRVNIPLTVEDVAYPDWLFAILAATGLSFCVLGIIFVARSDSIPSAPMLFCGLFAFGSLAACAVMAPYVATIRTTSDIVVNCSGEPAIYIEQTVTYLFSAWVGYACWGGALAGIILAITGVLSWLGWLHRTGIGKAQRGEYLETDGEASQEDYRSFSKGRKNL